MPGATGVTKGATWQLLIAAWRDGAMARRLQHLVGMKDPARKVVVYIGPADEGYRQRVDAVKTATEAITMYRVDGWRAAVHYRLLDPATECVVSPAVTASALLQLLAWAQITGDVDAVVRLRTSGEEIRRWTFGGRHAGGVGLMAMEAWT